MRILVLATILSFGLLVRLTALHAGRSGSQAGAGILTPDSAEYLETARTLAWSGRFARTSEGPAELVRTPGYPLLVAAVMRAEAHGATAGGAESLGPPRHLSAVQALLDVGLIALTYLLARRFLGPGAALLAAGLQAFAPVAIAASVRVLSDSLLALMLTAALLAWVSYLRRPRWRTLLAGAVLLAAAAYVRPIALLLPLPLAVVLLRRGWRGALAAVGVFAICVAPWVIRNGLAAGYWRFSGISAVNLYRYEAAAVQAYESNRPLTDVQEIRDAELRFERVMRGDETEPWTATDLRRMNELGWPTLQRKPGLAVALHLKGCLASLLPGATDLLEVSGLSMGQRGTLGVLQSEGLWPAVRHYFGGQTSPVAIIVVVLSCLLLAAVYFGAGLTAVRHLRLNMPAEAWLLLVAGLLLMLAPGPAGHPRFRVPVMPLLNVAAASSLVWLVTRRARAGQAVTMPGHKIVRPVRQRTGDQADQVSKQTPSPAQPPKDMSDGT